jgi:alpha-tubulin suppressor-like RCC1 family protein
MWGAGFVSAGREAARAGSGQRLRRSGSRRVAKLRVVVACLVLVSGLLAVCAEPASAQSVVAWGLNASGALGDGLNGGFSDVPVAVCAPITPLEEPPCPGSHLEGVVQLSAGGNHSLALLSNGEVVAWGSNKAGALGDGSKAPSIETQPVYVCLKDTESPTPTEPPQGICPETERLKEVVQISAGDEFSNVALLSTGHVVTWGSNAGGQLGIGKPSPNPKSSDVPVEACSIGVGPCPGAPLENISYVSAAPAHDVAVGGSEFRAVNWGADKLGQLGFASWYKTPPGVTRAEEVCPLKPSGFFPPLTAPQWPERWSTCTGALTRVRRVSFGLQHNVAMIRNSPEEEAELMIHGYTVTAWGSNAVGQLGDGESTGPNICNKAGAGTGTPCSDVPVPVCTVNASYTPPCTAGAEALQDTRAVAAGGSHTIAIVNAGNVAAWGEGQDGTIGNGGTADSDVPTYVCEPRPTSCGAGSSTELLKEVGAISAGSLHNLALLFNGEVVAWGVNKTGQLGNAEAGASSAPETCNSGFVGCSTYPVYVCETGYGAMPPCPAGDRLEAVTEMSAGANHSIAVGSFPVYPAWYRDVPESKGAVELGRGAAHLSIATSGTLTFQTPTEPVKCSIKDTEEVWNPLAGPGEDAITSLTVSKCVSKPCPGGKPKEIFAESLPWASHLTTGPPIRDDIEHVQLTVRCGTGLEPLEGDLTPEVKNGALVFGPGSGELENISGQKVKITGTDKLTPPSGTISAH